MAQSIKKYKIGSKPTGIQYGLHNSEKKKVRKQLIRQRDSMDTNRQSKHTKKKKGDRGE